MRIAWLAALVSLWTGVASAEPVLPPAYHLIPGQFGPDRSPDGNSIMIDAPADLILVDTGRHVAHTQSLLDYARTRGLPIAAIVNSHWHLDHSSGDIMIRAAFPAAPLYASNAMARSPPSFTTIGCRRSGNWRAASYPPRGRLSSAISSTRWTMRTPCGRTGPSPARLC